MLKIVDPATLLRFQTEDDDAVDSVVGFYGRCDHGDVSAFDEVQLVGQERGLGHVCDYVEVAFHVDDVFEDGWELERAKEEEWRTFFETMFNLIWFMDKALIWTVRTRLNPASRAASPTMIDHTFS